MFELQPSQLFKRNLKKLVSKNVNLANKVEIILQKMKENPNDISLRSHQVNLSTFGKVMSSRVTGDIRIIWRFDSKRNKIIVLVTVGGHSGSNKVYR